MKNIIPVLFIGVLLQSCTPQENYKAVRTEVLAVHDKVMMDSETAFKDKKRMDSLAQRMDSLKRKQPGLDTVKEKQNILELKNKLLNAEDQMDDWMHKFDAETGRKTDQEALSYFKSEKKKVESLDSLYKITLKESEEYISKFR